MDMDHDWMGAKLALFLGPDLVVIRRDDRPGLLWPGHWDLPGGGREPGETPLGCALRETREELSLRIDPSEIGWGRCYRNSIGRRVWFFAARLPRVRRRGIKLGDEGQEWRLMPPAAFLAHDQAVPPFKPRLHDYLDGVDGEDIGAMRNERPPARPSGGR